MPSVRLHLNRNVSYTINIEPRHRNHKLTIPLDPETMPRYAEILDTDGFPIEIEDELDQEFIVQLLSFGLDIMLVAAANYHVKQKMLEHIEQRHNTERYYR